MKFELQPLTFVQINKRGKSFLTYSGSGALKKRGALLCSLAWRFQVPPRLSLQFVVAQIDRLG